ncbi:Alpha/Beta hydrolase protein [Naematelia encephala]|uniref:Alpha/Beta hydrolase protein n=1 Tax=Naematelia encephala TaxID=71784 RepID=A0A1Y2AZB9_9TREE|nr:Alpha/Beta hydrolase protein [Naematelia encephala]
MSVKPVSLVYSTVGDLDLYFDLYVPDDAKGSLPAFIWYHSGGLVNGARNDMFLPTWLRDKVLTKGWLFFSVEYRLLLPSNGHDILTDVLSFQSFLSRGLVSHLEPFGVSLDLQNIAVGGSSAGGYMARLHSLNVTPKPKVILSLYGMGGDFLSSHWVDPHPQGVRFNGGFTTREFVAHLLDDKYIKPIANSPMVPIAGFDPGYTNDVDFRGSLYNYWQCFGLYLDPFTGVKGFTEMMQRIPHEEREAAVPELHKPLFVQLRVTELPPTVLVHGTDDTSVDIWESRKTYAQLKEAGIETELLEVEGAEHGCVNWPEKTRGPAAWAVYDKSFQFVEKYIK